MLDCIGVGGEGGSAIGALVGNDYCPHAARLVVSCSSVGCHALIACESASAFFPILKYIITSIDHVLLSLCFLLLFLLAMPLRSLSDSKLRLAAEHGSRKLLDKSGGLSGKMPVRPPAQ